MNSSSGKINSFTAYLILQLLFSNSLIFAQLRNFEVHKTPFTSSIGDDFSPAFYKNGIVYCSNSISDAVVSIKSENENLFNMLYVEEKDSGNWKNPELFSKELTTILNDGPCTFNAQGNIVYFARNNEIEGKFKDINNPANKLGIFKAELINGIWGNITPLPFNNTAYSIGTPFLSPDEKRLYFASDMPGGFGGTDIYYCNLVNNQWDKPLNMGPEINSAFDESYPFLCSSGRLFFSSNGHGGFGGKDIFYSIIKNGHWVIPIHLDADINSSSDDYGIITDKNFEWGYFSSNRRNNTDIYSFRAVKEQFGPCDTLSDYRKCYVFYDERFTDSLHLDHEWDFGHGIKKKGIQVEQCFSRPGAYAAVLTIIHHIADSTFTTKSVYNFEVETPSFPYISCETVGVVTNDLEITASKGNSISNSGAYYWNMGDGFNEGGQTISKRFEKSGMYAIELGLKGSIDSNGIVAKTCCTKTIRIVNDYQEKASYSLPEDENILLQQKNSLPLKNNDKNLYRVNTFLLAEMDALQSNEISNSLNSFSTNNIGFNESEELLPESQSVLNSIATLLKKHPDIKLVVAIHNDSRGSQKNNQESSDKIAETIKIYLANQGLESTRFECIGYGDSRPVTEKNLKDSQWLNKRIELIVVNKSMF